MLSVKQGDIRYHFLSFWYDSTWDWNPVTWTIGEHSTHSANGSRTKDTKILLFLIKHYTIKTYNNNNNNNNNNTWSLLENWKTMEHESDGDTNCNQCTQYSYQRIDKESGGLGNKRTSGDHPNDSIIQIGQNIEKSPGDLKRLSVSQTPVRNHQLTLAWKTLKRVK